MNAREPLPDAIMSVTSSSPRSPSFVTPSISSRTENTPDGVMLLPSWSDMLHMTMSSSAGRENILYMASCSSCLRTSSFLAIVYLSSSRVSSSRSVRRPPPPPLIGSTPSFAAVTMSTGLLLILVRCRVPMITQSVLTGTSPISISLRRGISSSLKDAAKPAPSSAFL